MKGASAMPSKVWNAVASGAVGVVGGTLTTGAFGCLNKNRELDIEMVRVWLSIFGMRRQDTSLSGRKFA
ncbi:hypothetical protein CK226_03010 [Mesorhizobium sp. WSM4311]|nr:hypothetical protein CK226_03010 [Mesorhizobium sp. WSM4311]